MGRYRARQHAGAGSRLNGALESASIAFPDGTDVAVGWIGSGLEGNYVEVELFEVAAGNQVLASGTVSASGFVWLSGYGPQPGGEYYAKLRLVGDSVWLESDHQIYAG